MSVYLVVPFGIFGCEYEKPRAAFTTYDDAYTWMMQEYINGCIVKLEVREN